MHYYVNKVENPCINHKTITVNANLITFSQSISSELSLQSDMPLHICNGCIHCLFVH